MKSETKLGLYHGAALHCAPSKNSQTACAFSSTRRGTAPHQPWLSPTREASSSWQLTRQTIHSPGKSMPWPTAHPKSQACHLFYYGLSVRWGSRTSLTCPPCPKSFMWWGLSVVCEQTLKAAAHPPPVRVPDGRDSMRILSLLPDKLKALFYGQQRPLPARATSSSFPCPESACSVDCPQGVGAFAGGNFIWLLGWGQTLSIPAPRQAYWAATPVSGRGFHTAAVFFSYWTAKMRLNDGQDWGNPPGTGVFGPAVSSEGPRWPSSQYLRTICLALSRIFQCILQIRPVAMGTYYLASKIPKSVVHTEHRERSRMCVAAQRLRLFNICLFWRNMHLESSFKVCVSKGIACF